MKKRKIWFCILLTCACVATGCAKEKTKNNNTETENKTETQDTTQKENTQGCKVEKDKITIHFELYQVNTEKQDDGKMKLNVDGFDASYDETSIPFLSYVLALPQDTTLDKISTANWSDTVNTLEDVDLADLKLAPVSEDSSSGTLEETSDSGFKVRVFSQDFQGIPVVYVSIYPITYDKEKSQVQFVQSGDFEIALKQEAWDLSHYDSPERIKNVVDNPELVDSYKVSEN
ncbi:hypothetical protein [Anaerosporobacter faecicola]|uniref:hypothetical protein n=1 Tax=Anaerosporobacter faecicola TaxID=2718714 RepID=UPI0014392D87|nr:hypothetical protein [Anaerosporobacter faecicola]